MYRPDRQREIKEKHWRGLVEKARRKQGFDPDFWKQHLRKMVEMLLQRQPPRYEEDGKRLWLEFQELLDEHGEAPAVPRRDHRQSGG